MSPSKFNLARSAKKNVFTQPPSKENFVAAGEGLTYKTKALIVSADYLDFSGNHLAVTNLDPGNINSRQPFFYRDDVLVS